MRVGVCDFPSAYAFPPHKYGGIERWLWAVAVGARQTGAEVCLLAPAWRDDLPGSARRLGRTIRLIGPILDNNYAERHVATLRAPHVELVGEISGSNKLEHLRCGRVMVYTCAPDYVEAGGGIRRSSPLRNPGRCAGLATRNLRTRRTLQEFRRARRSQQASQ